MVHQSIMGFENIGKSLYIKNIAYFQLKFWEKSIDSWSFHWILLSIGIEHPYGFVKNPNAGNFEFFIF